MVIMDNGDTSEKAKLWAMLTELMEQTNHHRQFSAQLHSQASDIKVRGLKCARERLLTIQ